MANIEMCINEDCPSKYKCLRYRSFPEEFIEKQVYSDFDPRGSEKCKFFLSVIVNSREMKNISPLYPLHVPKLPKCGTCMYDVYLCKCKR